MKLKLDKKERQILNSVENDEWKSIGNLEVEKKRYQEYATATFKKDKRINIRISSKDLQALQIKAVEWRIPYQTLIASILHKYITGRVVGKE